jgi:hypothetical protein
MNAMLYGCVVPKAAVDVDVTVTDGMPRTLMKYVGTVAVSVTFMAFGAFFISAQVTPAGSSELRQTGVTVVVTGTLVAEEFKPEHEYWFARVVALLVVPVL